MLSHGRHSKGNKFAAPTTHNGHIAAFQQHNTKRCTPDSAGAELVTTHCTAAHDTTIGSHSSNPVTNSLHAVAAAVGALLS